MTNIGNPYQQQQIPLIIAHRGGGGMAPENSQIAFDRAASLPMVHGLETDVHMTKDGVLVVAHDADVDRTTEGRGMIRDMTLAELQRLDLGYRFSSDGESHPFRGQGLAYMTLEELITRFPDHIINIDLKQHEPVVVERFVRLMRQYAMQERIVVGSFDTLSIKRLRQLMPAVATCSSYSEIARLYVLHKAGMSHLWWHNSVVMQVPENDGRLTLITPEFIRNVQAHGVQVHIWTVNEAEQMDRLLSWGVDGLITDYPERAITAVEKYKQARFTSSI